MNKNIFIGLPIAITLNEQNLRISRGFLIKILNKSYFKLLVLSKFKVSYDKRSQINLSNKLQTVILKLTKTRCSVWRERKN